MRPKSLCRLKNGFYPVIGISPCCRTNAQNSVQPASCSCLAQNLVDAFFCDVQAAFGVFHRIEKQPERFFKHFQKPKDQCAKGILLAAADLMHMAVSGRVSGKQR